MSNRVFYVRYALAALALMAVAILTSFSVPDPAGAQRPSELQVDRLLQDQVRELGDGELVRAIVTYRDRPTRAEEDAVRQTGVAVHTFDELPMIAVQGTGSQVEQLFSLRGPISVFANKKLEYMLNESRPLIGADRVESKLDYTGEGVGVAVIDSGVDGTHQDVRFDQVPVNDPDRMVQNVKILGGGVDISEEDFFAEDDVVLENQSNTDLTSGHGTHVTSTAGGDGTESDGFYTGIAPGADLVGIGAGDALFVLFALEGFDYALANQDEYNIKVINNSYGTGGKFKEKDPINVATKEAHDRGITVVFAAGNEGPKKNTLNPYSVAPWVIGVAAGEKDGKTLAGFSSRGKPGSKLYQPTLTAPGVDVVAARSATSVFGATSAESDVTGIAPEHVARYTTLSGTSMATPHVSGTAALMLQANPNLKPDEIKKILTKTATPMRFEKFEAGAGYLNAFEAVKQAEGSRRR